MKKYLARRQPATSLLKSFAAGLGGAVAIFIAVWLTHSVGYTLIMAPFGATCVLLFSLPSSPLSQPINVIGGHLVSAGIGFLICNILPDVWWAPAFAVGLSIMMMSALRVTHPPAGANPLVIFALHPAATFLVFPVLSGAVLLVAIATVFHTSTGTAYPSRAA